MQRAGMVQGAEKSMQPPWFNCCCTSLAAPWHTWNWNGGVRAAERGARRVTLWLVHVRSAGMRSLHRAEGGGRACVDG